MSIKINLNDLFTTSKQNDPIKKEVSEESIFLEKSPKSKENNLENLQKDFVKTQNAVKEKKDNKSAEDELETLYDKLSNATSNDKIAQIRAEIEKTAAENNYNDEEKINIINSQTDSIIKSYNNQISSINKDLKYIINPDKMEIINNEMMRLKTELKKEINTAEVRKFAHSNILPDNQKYELSDLYEELINTSNESDRDMITAKLHQKFNEFELDGETLAACLETMKSAINASYNTTDIEFYKDLQDVSDPEKKDFIITEHNISEQDNIIRNAKLDISISNAKSNLPQEQKEALTDKYNSLIEAKSPEEADKILAEINELTEKYSLKGEDLTESILISEIALNASIANQVKDLYKDLESANSEEMRNQINAEISQVYKKNDELRKDLNIKYYTSQSKLDKNILNEISDVCYESKNAKSPEEKLSINAKMLKIIKKYNIKNDELSLLNQLLISIR